MPSFNALDQGGNEEERGHPNATHHQPQPLCALNIPTASSTINSMATAGGGGGCGRRRQWAIWCCMEAAHAYHYSFQDEERREHASKNISDHTEHKLLAKWGDRWGWKNNDPICHGKIHDKIVWGSHSSSFILLCIINHVWLDLSQELLYCSYVCT